MRLFSSLGFVVLLLGGLTWGQDPQSATSNRVRARIQRAQQQQQQQQQNPADFAPDPPPIPTPAAGAAPNAAAPNAASTPAPVPTPPENLPPPTPPQVSYRDGLLTIQATNSSLQALLIAIRNKAGIQFEGLETGAPERVAIAMGPAPEADVLATILGGSNFDYIVMERPDSPGIVQRVVLSPKAGTAAASANAFQASHPPQPDVDEEEDAAEEPVAPQDTAVRPPLAQAQPQPQPSPSQQAPSSEQMLEELKRMQQQQAQQQQAQGQGTPQNPAPAKPPEN